MTSKNRMSAAEAMGLARGNMGWREWEQAFNGLLREGRWDWWQDRVVPVGQLRALLRRYRVPKPVIETAIAFIQSAMRKPGFPDRVIAKQFTRGLDLPPELDHLVGPRVRFSKYPFTVMGYIELKTGKAKPTKEQRRWLELASSCPGCFSMVARPEHMPYLRKVLIG